MQINHRTGTRNRARTNDVHAKKAKGRFVVVPIVPVDRRAAPDRDPALGFAAHEHHEVSILTRLYAGAFV